MDFHHRLTRKAIDIAVTKILRDIRNDTNRSVRNLVDLGALFSCSENQKIFFDNAKKILLNPNNPYNDFAYRIASEVDNATVKTVGLNLGYTSLTYGADKLRKLQAALGYPIPWLIAADVEKAQLQTLLTIEDMINDGRALGIYSHLFSVHASEDIVNLSHLAEHFEECFFAFDAPASAIDTNAAMALSHIHNAVVSIRLTENDTFSDHTKNTLQTLKAAHCLYGLSILYDDKNEHYVTSDAFIHNAVKHSASFIGYNPAGPASLRCRQAVYDIVRKTRGENGSPVITLEWSRDIRLISETIESRGALMRIQPAGLTSIQDYLINAAREPFSH